MTVDDCFRSLRKTFVPTSRANNKKNFLWGQSWQVDSCQGCGNWYALSLPELIIEVNLKSASEDESCRQDIPSHLNAWACCGECRALALSCSVELRSHLVVSSPLLSPPMFSLGPAWTFQLIWLHVSSPSRRECEWKCWITQSEESDNQTILFRQIVEKHRRDQTLLLVEPITSLKNTRNWNSFSVCLFLLLRFEFCDFFRFFPPFLGGQS